MVVLGWRGEEARGAKRGRGGDLGAGGGGRFHRVCLGPLGRRRRGGVAGVRGRGWLLVGTTRVSGGLCEELMRHR